MGDKERVKLSKLLSLLLRHNPSLAGLTVGSDGFTRETVDVVAGKIKRLKGFEWVTSDHIKAIVALDEKGRFEIIDNRLRALYGHSIPYVKIDYGNQQEVPVTLYHGTSPEAVESILKEGLKPMGRIKVHLSSSKSDAYEVGKRKTDKPVILAVKAREAVKNGVKIWKAGKTVYVADYIPPDYIYVLEEKLDNRSHKVILVAHCLLNQNSKAMGLVHPPYSSMVFEFLSLLDKYNIGVEVLPCPELEFIGIPRIPRTKTEYEELGIRKVCRKLALHVLKLAKTYVRAGCQILGLIGIARSPTCSVTQVYIGSGSKGKTLVKGRGIFIEELETAFKKANLKIPFLEWDYKKPEQSLKAIENLLKTTSVNSTQKVSAR